MEDDLLAGECEVHHDNDETDYLTHTETPPLSEFTDLVGQGGYSEGSW